MGKVSRFDRRSRWSKDDAWTSTRRGHRRRRHLLTGIGSSGIIWAGLAAAALGAASLSGGLPSNCDIKGNVSIETGERIYHVRGQDYYDETRISLAHGERWFCSEAEAREAGWRRALR